MGCIMSFVDADTGWMGFGDKFQMTSDGGATWEDITLPVEVEKVAAVSLRTATDGYLLDNKSILYITQDGGKTWSQKSQLTDSQEIMGFATGPFINEIPQASIRFTDANNGLAVLGLSGKEIITILRTSDGGSTWKEDTPPEGMGVPMGAIYISRDGKFITTNLWGKGTTVLKYD